MSRKDRHVSETPATQWLRTHGVAYTEHPYDYVEHGGTAESARQLGVDEQIRRYSPSGGRSDLRTRWAASAWRL